MRLGEVAARDRAVVPPEGGGPLGGVAGRRRLAQHGRIARPARDRGPVPHVEREPRLHRRETVRTRRFVRQGDLDRALKALSTVEV